MNTPDNVLVKSALVALAIFSIFCAILGLIFRMDPIKFVTYCSPGYFIILGIVHACRTTFPPEEK
ncbi:MAG: hypothetical protein L3J03_05430 [Desulfobacterales bacterium]|nr:hypothetical protein [Desulfobacterales bacterium]